LSNVSIIIVNWNGYLDTIECLDSLLKLSYQDFSVVICDNGSTDGSVAMIKAWAINRGLDVEQHDRESVLNGTACRKAKLIIIDNKMNLGFAGGNNIGIRYAMSHDNNKYLWLLNNDTVADSKALSHLVERMEMQPHVGMCGSTIRFYQNPERVQAFGGGYYLRWIGLPWHYKRFAKNQLLPDHRRAEARMNYVEGASMFVSRTFVEKVGLMCEEYFLYFEEADWAMRGKGLFQLAYEPESVVYHKVGASIGTSSNPLKKSYLCDYYSIRNRILFTKRYFAYALPSVYLFIFFELIMRLILGKMDRVMMILRIMISPVDIQLDIASSKLK